MSAQKFFCSRCRERYAVLKAVLKGYSVVVAARCPNRHAGKFFLNLNDKESWLDELKIGVQVCVCGKELSLQQDLPRGHYHQLILNCPTHGVTKRFVATPIWNDIGQMHMGFPSVAPGYQSTPYESNVVVPPSSPSDFPESPIDNQANWSTEIVDQPEVDDRVGSLKFCPSCGEEIIAGSFFCTNCGAELK